MLPYLDRLATISNKLPLVLKTVFNQPPSNISIAAEAVPLTSILP